MEGQMDGHRAVTHIMPCLCFARAQLSKNKLNTTQQLLDNNNHSNNERDKLQ